MKQEPRRFHSDTKYNDLSTYRGCVNSPLSYKQAIADDEAEADTEESDASRSRPFGPLSDACQDE